MLTPCCLEYLVQICLNCNLCRTHLHEWSWQRCTLAPVLNVLHWLPIHHRISFKIASLTYKILNSKDQSYLADLLSPYVPAHTLRSSNFNFLVEAMTRTVFGSQAFRSSSPKIWNRSPDWLRSACSLSSFKTGLKTHLFCQP